MTRILRRKALFLMLPLFALFLLELGAVLVIPGEPVTSPESTLSALVASGTPTIDSGAVMVESEGTLTKAVALCQSLPIDIWQLLLVLYILLLVLNFREQDRLHGSVTTWMFEGGLTLFFIIEWALFDTCRVQSWFPLALMKVGLIVFLLFQVKSLITKHHKD